MGEGAESAGIHHCKDCFFRTETILTPEELDKKFDGDLKKALKPQRYVIVAYITSFVVVGEQIIIVSCIEALKAWLMPSGLAIRN